MNDEVMDELGPIDYLVVEFPAGKADFSGAMAEKLTELVEAGTVRVLDLLIITKDEGGAVDAFELHEFEDGDVGALRELGAEFAAAALARRTSATSPRRSSPAPWPRRSSGRTPGRRRSPRRSVTPAASWSPAAASPCRLSSPPSRRERTPLRPKEPDMPLGRGRRGPGVIGRPVARTAVAVGTVAVVAHGVGRRSDRRGDRRDDRQDRRGR